MVVAFWRFVAAAAADPCGLRRNRIELISYGFYRTKYCPSLLYIAVVRYYKLVYLPETFPPPLLGTSPAPSQPFC